MPQATRTRGLTMPQPAISIQPWDLQTRHGGAPGFTEAPPQTWHFIDTSPDGSVNGVDGLYYILPSAATLAPPPGSLVLHLRGPARRRAQSSGAGRPRPPRGSPLGPEPPPSCPPLSASPMSGYAGQPSRASPSPESL